MAGTHTQAVLKKLRKQKFIQLFLKTEANMGLQVSTMANEIRDLLGYLLKLEADVAILKNLNEKLLQRLTGSERQRRAKAQYFH